MKRVSCVAAVTAAALTAAGCAAASTPSDGRIPVVASTDAWGSVVSAIGGDRVKVTSLIDGPAVDPHSYESKASDGLDVSESKLFVYNGGGYDAFADDLAKQGDGVATINAFSLHRAKDSDDNEHVWYDLPTVRRVAAAIADQLSTVDSKGAKTYRANLKRFDDGLAKESAKAGKIAKDHTVIATEPVAHYLLREAGLADATPEQFVKAIEDETDVPAAVQHQVLELIDQRRVDAVINNPQTSDVITGKVVDEAKKNHIPVVDVTETLPDGVHGYLPWIGRELAGIAAAVAK